jgi:Cysteine-rich secretory protein family
MRSPRCGFGLVFLSLVFSAVVNRAPWEAVSAAYATTASPPTVYLCNRRYCRQCLEYSGADNRCVKCAPIPGCRIAGSGGGGLSADAQAILNAHNGYRAKHCVPALTWSVALAAEAQGLARWLQICTFGPSRRRREYRVAAADAFSDRGRRLLVRRNRPLRL